MSDDAVADSADEVLDMRIAQSDLEAEVQYHQFSAGIAGLLGGLAIAQGARGVGDDAASTWATGALLVVGAVTLLLMWWCIVKRSSSAARLKAVNRKLLTAERAEETAADALAAAPTATAQLPAAAPPRTPPRSTMDEPVLESVRARPDDVGPHRAEPSR